MRKNSIRKLIHGILDLLPLFVIPIFAININQKSVEPISIEVQEKISVDFNQKIINGNFENNNDWSFINTDYFNYEIANNKVTITLTENASGDNLSLRKYNFNNELNHVYFFKLNFYSTNSSLRPYIEGAFATTVMQNTVNNEYVLKVQTTNTFNQIRFKTYSGLQGDVIEWSSINLFDLTQMGLENLTVNELNNLFPNSYYPYTESQKMLVDKLTTTTYDDTDIGSQFLYSLYISTDNYFNMNNVFNLNGVYSWFEMNIFGGSAPLSIYIVWNIIIYELVMDLLMLLYALFMFFIDACQKLIDKPLESIK